MSDMIVDTLMGQHVQVEILYCREFELFEEGILDILHFSGQLCRNTLILMNQGGVCIQYSISLFRLDSYCGYLSHVNRNRRSFESEPFVLVFCIFRSGY